MQPQLRKARQPGAQGGRSVPGKARRSRQAQLAAGDLLLGHQLGPRALGGRTQGRALGVEALPRIGERNLARGAVQQGHATLALQLTQMLAHR